MAKQPSLKHQCQPGTTDGKNNSDQLAVRSDQGVIWGFLPHLFGINYLRWGLLLPLSSNYPVVTAHCSLLTVKNVSLTQFPTSSQDKSNSEIRP